MCVGEGEEETNVLRDIVPKDVEDGVEDVRLFSSQPRLTCLNDQSNAGQLADGIRLVAEELLQAFSNVFVKVDPPCIAKSWSVNQYKGIWNPESFAVVERVTAHPSVTGGNSSNNLSAIPQKTTLFYKYGNLCLLQMLSRIFE